MSVPENALPAGGPAKLTQNPGKPYAADRRDRRALLLTPVWCFLLVDSFFWHWPWGLGLTAAGFLWYALALGYLGRACLRRREDRVLLVMNLALLASFALTSNSWFRWWNLLALLVLVPVHLMSLSGAGRLPWQQPVMLWERLCLLLVGLFGQLGALGAVLTASSAPRRRTWAAVLGAVGALVLLAVLVPVLASADALFAAATAEVRIFLREHFTSTVWKLVWALILTPFVFSLLYFLRRPTPLSRSAERTGRTVDGLGFAVVLAAVAALYALFLAVQSAGLFGGEAYLASRGLSYAEWARSGFFQMVGVTAVNLTVLLVCLTFSRRSGGSYAAVRLLGAVLTAESFLLLASAAWRMTLYVEAYGLSFKRCMTYWGMGMMALFFLAAAWKLVRPDFGFFRAAAPVALAGWLVINCVPVDYLVAKDQVDRCLSGESQTIDVEYLLYSLSYDTLSQLERLDGDLICQTWTDWGDSYGQTRLSTLLDERRAEARRDCADWRSWDLSACLAAMGGD